MSDSHRGSRFLRFLRSLCAKTACARRAIVAFFVVASTILATFMIMPSASMGASSQGESNQVQAQSQDKSGNVEPKTASSTGAGVKDGADVKDDAKEANTAETKNSQTSSRPAGSGAGSAQSVDSTNQQHNNGVEGAHNSLNKDAANAAEKSVKKDESANKLLRKRRAAEDRAAAGSTSLPKVCTDNRKKSFRSCYDISYDFGTAATVDHGKTILIQRGSSIIINPEFKFKFGKKQKTTMPSGLWFELEGDNRNSSVPSWVNFEKTENGVITKVQDTEKQKGFDGSVTLRPNGKWDYGSYRFKVFAYYKNKKEKISVTISVKVDVSGVQNDLSLSLYDFGKADDKVSVSNDKITIKPKPNSQGSSGSSTGSTDKKDTYDSINKLFIDSQSKDKPGYIYHHMICKTGSDDNASYTVDSVNGLSLKDKKDNPSADMQIQFEHKEGENRPFTGAADSALYEDDKYTEESQSWISGTPTSAGTFECRVFAFKNAELTDKASGKHPSNLVDQFKKNAETDAGKKSLFEGNIVDSNTWKTDDFKQGVDWDYKSVTIEVKSSEPQKPKPPKIGDNDLTLKVYPFKNDDGSLPAELPDKNNKISAILGMSLKPFVDATSAADSANKITLRVLCSKGEKKKDNAGGGASTDSTGSTGSGSAVGGSSVANNDAGSQPTQPSGSSQSSETRSSKPYGLGLSVPEDTKQTRCNEAGDGKCTAKNVASQSSMEVSIKPTEVGNYQCVVFALKNDALAKFNDAISKATQSGKQTPADIDKALADDKSLKENKDFAAFMLNIDSVSNFTLPNTGGQSWNLQLGILAALLVNLLAAGFVVSQSERGRKLILGRWRGLCNHV